MLFAVIAGGLLGLVLAFGIWRANIAFKNDSPPDAQTGASPTPAPSSDFKISIAKPENNQVITALPMNISGITAATSYVIGTNETDDAFATAASDGTFNMNMDLTGGANPTKIFAFDANGKMAQTDLMTVFSTEYDKDAVPASTASPSADAIRQKVDQKLKEATSPAIAYLGTVTDLTDNTIQIKSVGNGEIKQVSWTEAGTVFVKSTTTPSKIIKFSEVAIGDFIIGMGVKNGSDVLKAKRILVVNPVKDNARVAVIGRVSETASNKLTLKDFNNNSFTVSPAKGITIKFSSFGKEDLVIVVGTQKDNAITARSVFKAVAPKP